MRKKKYTFTPEMLTEIKKVYQQAAYMPGYHKTAPVRRLAEKFGIPRWKVSRQAGIMGLRHMTKKEGKWTESELKILERNAYKHPETIQKRLRKDGFHRSVQGIVLKRKRMHLLKSFGFDNTLSLAECLGVDAHAVVRYIQKGWLKARRRGTRRTRQQGGDHWLIKEKDIRAFIIENVSILDFRKIDKFWLVDLLAGGSNGVGPLKEKQDPAKDIKDTKISYYDKDNNQIRSDVLGIFEEAQAMI